MNVTCRRGAGRWAGEEVSRDHSGLARRLCDLVRAPLVGFGRWDEGRSEIMQRLAASEAIDGGEGVDKSFDPDEGVADGDIIEGPDWRIEVLHILGHFAGHLAFALEQDILTGDHVLRWASTLISPDGHLRQFLRSCSRLRRRQVRAFLPGHGEMLTEPHARLDWLVAHRLEREAEIVLAWTEGESRIPALVERPCTDTPRTLWPAAARNVLAHLIAMVEERRVEPDGGIGMDSRHTTWCDRCGRSARAYEVR
jgi:glyoxylase-like metal-dependent hydrolase (beta-lactamase superfamily II)